MRELAPAFTAAANRRTQQNYGNRITLHTPVLITPAVPA